MGNKLQVIEKNNARVLTTMQLAEVFGTETAAITKNFNRNKDRYEAGKHFFAIQGVDLKHFKTEYQIDSQFKHSNTIYLWTEKGVFLHAKSLNTDKAWNAYSELVDDYFNKVEQLQDNKIPTIIPQTIEDILITALTSMKEMKFENSELKKAVSHLAIVVDNEVWVTDHQKADIQLAVKTRMGQLKTEAIDAHFQSIFSALNTYFNVPKYDKIPRKDIEVALDFVRCWYPKRKTTSE